MHTHDCTASLNVLKTYINHVELQVSTNDYDSQSWECKRPVRVSGSLDSHEQESNDEGGGAYAHEQFVGDAM